MRTTITINDQLYREAKARSALMGSTVSSFIADAVRERLATLDRGPGTVVRLPAFDGEVTTEVDVNDTSAVMDYLDQELPVHARR